MSKQPVKSQLVQLTIMNEGSFTLPRINWLYSEEHPKMSKQPVNPRLVQLTFRENHPEGSFTLSRINWLYSEASKDE
ncbi:hypothetical protein [Bacillus massiliglaciei]|uniref:hypothetical protein n=1 Tax=Bacillus massiliglaciei TaxID=1816693 RepID=UPI000DA63305|nr:hypothetical protein [Bacillus massiliglaciei]